MTRGDTEAATYLTQINRLGRGEAWRGEGRRWGERKTERERSLETRKGKERRKRKGEGRSGGRGGEESHLANLSRSKRDIAWKYCSENHSDLGGFGEDYSLRERC